MSVLNHPHVDDIIVDADEHFTIDTTTRAISSESNKKLTIMQYDNKSERYSFDVNKIIDGHDLTLCNRVQVHFINIGSNKQKHPGLYLVDDVQVNDKDPNKLTFSWLISQDATQLSGILSFLVSFECVDGDTVLYRWSSSTFNSIQIVAGMDNDNTIAELYADELLAWQNAMETEYIPTLVDTCYVERDFATSEEIAEIFSITDSTDIVTGYVQEADVIGDVLTLTKNDGSIVSFNAEGEKSKNLFNILKSHSITSEGVTITLNKDTQTILINGTATAESTVSFSSGEVMSINVKAGETFSTSRNTAVNVGLNNKNEPVNALLYVYSIDSYATQTILNDAEINRLYIWYSAGDVFNNVEIQLQVEEGTVATNYVPYYGAVCRKGDAEIQFAESERQKSTNLCQLLSVNTSNAGVSAITDGEQQRLKLNGVCVVDADYYGGHRNLYPLIKNAKGKTFTISNRIVSGSYTGGNILLFIGSHDESIWYDRFSVALNSSSTFTITTDHTYDTLMVFVIAGTTIDNLEIEVQIEEGDIATDWQYSYGTIVHTKEIAGLKGQVLWENLNPTTTFGTQDVTLSSSDYDYLEIYWFGSTSNLRSCVSIFDKNSNNYGFIMSWASTNTNGVVSYVRNANVGRPDGDFTKVHFEVAWEAQGATSEFAQNNACIPYKIIGYKRS